MNDADHDELRRSLGAYLLAALDPDDHRRVADHLATCPTCRDELAGLTDIPARLAALTPADVDALSANPAPTSAERFVTVALARQRRRHRTQRVWPAIAVAATIVAAIAIVRRPGNETEPAALALAALDGGAAVAAAAPIAKPWGTEVRLTARQLTASNGYRMWVVDRSGHREVAATWAATAANAYRVTGATGITSRDLARIEITTTTDDTPLLAYES